MDANSRRVIKFSCAKFDGGRSQPGSKQTFSFLLVELAIHGSTFELDGTKPASRFDPYKEDG